MSIYVEILVRAPIDVLWAHTQTPAQHERWDLRFSRIDYLPKSPDTEAQRFQYTTRIGCGLEVSGEGETVGQRDLTDGSRFSALKFGSAEPVSIIREGSGYWKYIPTGEGIRLLTRYDYRTRFGAAGALFDRLVFRPLLGWATAWSFDRLRLWLEEGVRPEDAARQAVVHALARVALAAIFAYQGLVPKLLAHNIDEVILLGEAGVPGRLTSLVVVALGVSELFFAAALIVWWRQRWPTVLSGWSVAVATAVVALYSPRFFQAAFNPLSLNLAVAALATVDWMVLPGIPSGARCLRRPQGPV
jgi:DoxX-like protein